MSHRLHALVAAVTAAMVIAVAARLASTADPLPSHRVFLPYLAAVGRPADATDAPLTDVPLYAVTANQIADIAQDPRSGDLWTASAHGGVVQWTADGVEVARFTRADGLPSNRTRGVAFAADGTVWVATGRGAARRSPDGVWTSVLPPHDVDRTGLEGEPETVLDDLTAAAIDRDGGVWFGRAVGEIRLAPDGTWEAPPPSAVRTAYELGTASIRPSANGDVWIASKHSGVRVRRSDGRWERWPEIGGMEWVSDIGFGLAGEIWSLPDLRDVDRDGTARIHVHRLADDGTWVPDDVAGVPTAPNNRVTRLDVDQRGRRWLAFSDARIVVPDAVESGRWTVETGIVGLRLVSRTGLGDLMLDDRDEAWIGTDLGLEHRHADGTYTQHLASGMARATGGVVAPSRDGVWFGGDLADDGVAHLATDGIWTFVAEAAGRRLNGAFAAAVGPDGTAWFGLLDDVARRTADGRWSRLGQTGAMADGRVIDLTVAPDGTAWWLQPSFAASPGRDRRSPVCHAQPDAARANCDGPAAGPTLGASAIHAAADGTVWVAGYDGSLARRTVDGDWAPVDVPATFGGNPLYALATDRNGVLWVRLADGVAKRDGDGRWTTAADDPSFALVQWWEPSEWRVRGFAVDAGGRLWVGGLEEGGVKIRALDGTWRAVGEAEGLPPGVVTDVAEAPDGRVWVGTERDGAVGLPPER